MNPHEMHCRFVDVDIDQHVNIDLNAVVGGVVSLDDCRIAFVAR
jgi:hypothetical protein